MFYEEQPVSTILKEKGLKIYSLKQLDEENMNNLFGVEQTEILADIANFEQIFERLPRKDYDCAYVCSKFIRGKIGFFLVQCVPAVPTKKRPIVQAYEL